MPERRKSSQTFKDIKLFLSQFSNTVTFLLIFALVLSASMGQLKESSIILVILLLSAMLGFYQERKASKAVEMLRSMLKTLARVKREGIEIDVPVEEVVPGDIVLLKAGDVVPADSLIIISTDLYVNESILTGESYPAEKRPGILAPEIPLIKRTNVVFKGTSITCGTATVVAVGVGSSTEIGKIESHLGTMQKETAFEKGIRKFGIMLIRVALAVAVIVMSINIVGGREPIDSILFALALSVGLAPEMLPAIVTITLSFGAKRLAAEKVIVKKLASIQNLGAIDILCTDKTGTLTEGEVKIHSCVTPDGKPSDRVSLYAYLNAYYESGYPNPMDLAIREQLPRSITDFKKFDEVPYDFNRKRLSIVVEKEEKHLMITKGALKNILEVCDSVELNDGSMVSLHQYNEKIQQLFEDCSSKGLRTIGLSYKDVTDDPVINREDETAMIFAGFVLLFDPLKKDIQSELETLRKKGIKLKIITGDNVLIAKNIATQIGIPSQRILTSEDLNELSDQAIVRRVGKTDIFAEIEPSQKERIVRALQSNGHVVGYLGDGVNDAPALKTADLGISVNNAVDVAKESADMVLMEKTLKVLSAGVSEGRQIYMNTLKYIFVTISANFGNMISMGIGSLVLPFFPLLPSQILLTNFLTDIPALSIASDNVDNELLKNPRRWNMHSIRSFMYTFGAISSLFDFLTFGVLLWMFHVEEGVFRTSWFVESVITEILILFILRTRRSFSKSRIGRTLLISSIGVIILVTVIPYIPLFSLIGLQPLPLNLLFSVFLIATVYGLVGEITKKLIFKKVKF
jgi:Mg2+-importing ATPase